MEEVKIGKFYGIYINGNPKDFWKIKCPCGVEKTFAINNLPEKTTLMPCGNGNHYIIGFDEKEELK